MPRPHVNHHRRQTILIAGAGVAGLEALLALRSHLGGTVKIEMLSPDHEFVYRPLSVTEPFGLGEVQRVEIEQVVSDQHAVYRKGSLARVNGDSGEVVTTGGERISYDFLVVAVGARALATVEGAVTFRGPEDRRAIEQVLAGVQAGSIKRIQFAAPPGHAWMLPLYELAMFTSAWARERGLSVRLSLSTGEIRPLEAFGPAASKAVAKLLFDAGVGFTTGGGDSFDPDAVISLPTLKGPGLPGLPHDEDGFIPTDRYGAVRGLKHVYAAGDGTWFPIKQGGIAAQQADAAASSVAAALGAIDAPEQFRPVLRGMLLTGDIPHYLRAADDSSEVAYHPLWWPPGKIAGRHLAPYLGSPALARAPLEDRPADAELESEAEAVADEREAVDLLLELADANASRGSFGFAVKCLEAAENVGGPLPEVRQADRRKWADRAQL